jgi:hypothetical protein
MLEIQNFMDGNNKLFLIFSPTSHLWAPTDSWKHLKNYPEQKGRRRNRRATVNYYMWQLQTATGPTTLSQLWLTLDKDVFKNCPSAATNLCQHSQYSSKHFWKPPCVTSCNAIFETTSILDASLK